MCLFGSLLIVLVPTSLYYQAYLYFIIIILYLLYNFIIVVYIIYYFL